MTTKLIRDGIPDLAAKAGQQLHTTVATDEAYRYHLRAKLGEEAVEYLTALSDEAAIEELADILEVVHALAELHGCTAVELERVRLLKWANRGGFRKHLLLHTGDEPSDGRRPSINTLTSDQLDALYDQLDQAHADVQLLERLRQLDADRADEHRADRDRARRVAVALENDLAAMTAVADATLRHVQRHLDTIGRVRALHQPMRRAGFTICAHCSGWNGVLCRSLVTEYPCPTIRALGGPGGAT